MKLRLMLQNLYNRYDRMMEKQGFYVVLVLCVLVILLSAAITYQTHHQENPIPEVESISAGGMQNAQTLHDAQSKLIISSGETAILPNKEPFRFSQPVSGLTDRDFSIDEPQLFEAAHYWRVHPGIDLQAAYGTPVAACADGRVMNIWSDSEMGLCIRLLHEYGYETLYAGLSDASYVQANDPVKQGQTIGHVGNGVLAEADAQPHLHFEVWKGSSAIDPAELFLGLENP